MRLPILRAMPVASAFLLQLASPLAASEVALGHPASAPSPEHPVG
jgi:hypothetical protein